MAPGVQPDQLESQGHDLIAKGHACLAEAARLRSKRTSAAGDWIPVASLPVPTKTSYAAARAGSLVAIKKGRTWLTTRADAEAWLKSSRPATAANDDDDDVREALGLAPRRAS